MNPRFDTPPTARPSASPPGHPALRMGGLAVGLTLLAACGGTPGPQSTPAPAAAPAAAPPAAAPQAAAPAGGQTADQDLTPVWEWDPTDPRLGLAPGREDAGQAAWGMELLVNLPRPEGFGTNTDLAFSGDWAFVGNYSGFNVYDIADPTAPQLRVSVLCPGNQGDLSVFGNLLFKSVQAAGGRLDCGSEGVEEAVSEERFRGVRIFDITNIEDPLQVAAVQTCRGSHTHTLVTRPGDTQNVYVYVSGTSGVRPGEELEGCSGLPPEEDPGTSLFQIEVIRVPLAAPHEARIVSEPRVFADPQTGDIAALRGLTREGRPSDSPIRACHDITSYPEIGLAGGACSGNGLLLDITDPENPLRIDEVADANFAYWHSATFNNDGTKVIFTDEWGGGSSPRCREIDPPEWGGNAIFEIVDGKMRHMSYYKLPVPIVPTCVAHNGSLVPVPGRDIKVQSWYQGGISVFDFTDAGNPVEIAFFNRGPSTGGGGGFWSAYWYNGYVYGSEMGRGFDVFRLIPNEHLSQNEIDAAMSVQMDKFNAQHQPRITWPVSFAVTRSYLDQLARAEALPSGMVSRLTAELDRAEQLPAGNDRRAAAQQLASTAAELDREALSGLAAGRMDNPTRVRALLAGSLRELAATLD